MALFAPVVAAYGRLSGAVRRGVSRSFVTVSPLVFSRPVVDCAGGYLVVPDGSREVVVGLSGGAFTTVVTDVAFVSNLIRGAPPPEGSRLRLWFPAGGSFNGLTLPAGTVVNIEVFQAIWSVTGGSY